MVTNGVLKSVRSANFMPTGVRHYRKVSDTIVNFPLDG